MKKRVCFSVLAMLLCLLMSGGSLASYADGSHGFYMNCDASVTGGKSDGFMIDFYSDSADALCTYFSNANWSMNTDATAKRFNYKSITGGGAYAGLQILDHTTQRRGIMSFWRYDYIDGKTGKKEHLYAEAIYGKTTHYDNEGSGTSCVMPFDWESGRWHCQLLLCWQDVQTGYTFMGTWFYDYEEDVWSLFAYYNTKLVGSYIQGGVGQFLENFSESQGARYRSFRYRNIYFLPHGESEWVSSPTVSLRSDGNPKAFGEAKLGISEDNTYVWASVDGKSETDTDHEIKITPTLTQPERPATIGTPKISEITVDKQAGGVLVDWELDEHSTPQLSYTLKVFDTSGKQLSIRKASRPEVESQSFDTLKSDAVRVELTVTDVFGQSTTKSFETESYKLALEGKTPAGDGSETPEGSEAPKPSVPSVPSEPDKTPTEGGSSSEKESKAEKDSALLPVIVGASVGGVLILGILLVILKKRKNNP